MRSLIEIEHAINSGEIVYHAERAAYQAFRWLETQPFFPDGLHRDAGNQDARERVFGSLQTHGIAAPQWLALPTFQRLIVKTVSDRLDGVRANVQFALDFLDGVTNGHGSQSSSDAVQSARQGLLDQLDALAMLDDALSVDAFNLSTMVRNPLWKSLDDQ